MKKDIPKIIQEVGFDFSWKDEKVWKLDVLETEMDISELIWHFDMPFLSGYKLTPKEVINFSEKHKAEYERTMNADLQYPIDIMENKGRWLILDGLHRLMKNYIQGKNRVMVRIIPREMTPKILK